MSICQFMESNEVSDWICVLPANHAGTHDCIDAMGMCGENDDCRATRKPVEPSPVNGNRPMDWSHYRTARENAIQHNHR